MTFVYKGHARRGQAFVITTAEPPDVLVPKAFKRGVRDLVATVEGSDDPVGGIGVHWDTGKRTWWADRRWEVA